MAKKIKKLDTLLDTILTIEDKFDVAITLNKGVEKKYMISWTTNMVNTFEADTLGELNAFIQGLMRERTPKRV